MGSGWKPSCIVRVPTKAVRHLRHVTSYGSSIRRWHLIEQGPVLSFRAMCSDPVPKPTKQNIGQVATMLLSEGLGSRVRLRVRGTPRLTNQLRLALDSECLGNPTR